MPTINQRNYAALTALFPGLEANGNRNFHRRLESKGFMPLSFENIGGPRFSMMHTYEQNGDLMRDPDIEMIVSDGNVYCYSYRQDGLAIMREYVLGSKGARDTDNFLAQWLRNLKAQGFKPDTMPAPATPAVDDMTDDELLRELGVEPAKPVATPAQVYRRAGKVLGKAKATTSAPIITRAALDYRASFQARMAARNT